jgi:hypothetical protein
MSKVISQTDNFELRKSNTGYTIVCNDIELFSVPKKTNVNHVLHSLKQEIEQLESDFVDKELLDITA